MASPNEKSGRAVVPQLTGKQTRVLLDALIEGVVVQDGEGKVIHFNPAALKILGLKPDELLGASSLDPRWRAVREDLSSFPGEEHPASVALKSGLTQAGKIMGVYQPSGELRWVEVTAVPLVKDTQTYQVVVTFRDVTDERWFGESSSQWIGKSLKEALGVDAFDLIEPFFDQALRGYEQHFEHEIPYKLGQTRTVQVAYIPDKATDGSVQGVYAVIHDITSQTQAAKVIQEKEDTLNRTINALPVLIGYWDRDLKNGLANQAYGAYFGKDPKFLKGKHIREAIGNSLYEMNLPYMNAALKGIPQIFEREILMPSGETRETLASYIPDVLNGEVSGFFVIVTDISLVKRLERERKAIEAKMISASKLSTLGEMAGGVAHEINNPITIIAGIASRLRSQIEQARFDEPRAIADLKQIQATVDRIAKIVRGLLSFSRDTYGDLPEKVNISQLISDATDLCREKFKNHSVELKLNGDQPLWVNCRAVQVSQILLNLLNNAFDAVQTLEEKWIEIQINHASESVIVSVIDSGKGISPVIAEKIMQPFFTTKGIGKGTGLGLSLSKGLAEQNGGSLAYIDQSPNTRFDLILPRIRS